MLPNRSEKKNKKKHGSIHDETREIAVRAAGTADRDIAEIEEKRELRASNFNYTRLKLHFALARIFRACIRLRVYVNKSPRQEERNNVYPTTGCPSNLINDGYRGCIGDGSGNF